MAIDSNSADGTPIAEGTEYGRRADFLIAMYEQLMGDINRHIVVVWQMVGVLAATVVGFVLAEKQGVPTAYAAILVIVVTAWVVEHLYDSNYWYNRNLVMITNIERVFLTPKDVDHIHPYFSEHRKKSSFLTHLNIQKNYAYAILALTTIYFISHSVIPTWEWGGNPDLVKWIPFALLVWFVDRNATLRAKYEKKYADYLAISPGIDVGRHVEFGATHGAK